MRCYARVSLEANGPAVLVMEVLVDLASVAPQVDCHLVDDAAAAAGTSSAESDPCPEWGLG